MFNKGENFIERISRAIYKAQKHLLIKQTKEGCWVATIRTGGRATSTHILLDRYIGAVDKEREKSMVKWLKSHQNPDGGWGRAMKEEVSGDLNTTCAVRFQPLIPGLTDTYEHMDALIKESRDVGATHIIAEYLKIERRIWRRMKPILRKFGLLNTFRELYEIPSKGQFYWRKVDEDYKREKLTKLAQICKNYGVDFTTCKEGFFNLHTTDDCCGAHLPNRVTLTAYEIYKLAKQKGQATWEDFSRLLGFTPYSRALRKFWQSRTIEKRVSVLKAAKKDGRIIYLP